MAVHDDLGKRMKEFYEQVPKTHLVRRMPVALRIKGKDFHTFTKGFQKPFDELVIKTMQETMKYLCENIQGCVIGYTQSNEIILILIDYEKLTSIAWLSYEVQKMCSVAASMTTFAFNKFFARNVNEYFEHSPGGISDALLRYNNSLSRAVEQGAMFDCGCFNIPKEEVTNLVYWRQLDAMHNSVQMVGYVNFSQRELQNKSCKKIKEMLVTQRGIDWDGLPAYQKQGSCCVRNKIVLGRGGFEITICLRDTTKTMNAWIIDKYIPVFAGEGRGYIERLIYVGEF